MTELRSTQSHFIRCIKANSQKKPRIFEGSSCLEQLQCAGVFEAVSIRKVSERSERDFWKTSILAMKCTSALS